MKYLKWILALAIGGIVGFSYSYFIGCHTGSCAITSSPVNSTIYGAVMGLLLVNTFAKEQKETTDRKT